MSEPFFPTGDADVDVLLWTGTPNNSAGSLFTNVDETFREPADDSSYITAVGGSASPAIFSKTFPGSYSVTSYNDDGAVPVLPTARIVVNARVQNVGATDGLLARWAVRRSGTNHQDFSGASDLSVPRASIANLSWTLTNDPITNSPWTLDLVRQTSFGIIQIVTIGGELLRLYRTWIAVHEIMNVPEQRARLREARGEPAFFCAICALPFPRSILILVRDPDHPHVGRLVCPQDHDDYYPPETTEGPLVVEGDIDREDRW